MSIRQISQTIAGTTDFTDLKEEVTRNARGLNTISLSEYDTTAACVVKVGSVFENNNATFLVETADETPTGYSVIANSTIFYLYYDESAEAFIFSSTAPTWSDALHGYYNGNDRAYFSMYKDSGGTLYVGKSKIENKGILSTKTIPIGDWNMDATSGVNVTHGLPDNTAVRAVSVIVRNDANTGVYSLSNTSSPVDGSIGQIGSTAIGLSRVTSGFFDSTDFNSTSYNRGWITFTYIA